VDLLYNRATTNRIMEFELNTLYTIHRTVRTLQRKNSHATGSCSSQHHIGSSVVVYAFKSALSLAVAAALIITKAEKDSSGRRSNPM